MNIHVADTNFSVALGRRSFRQARRGYDPGEVDAFLDTLAAEAAAIVDAAMDERRRSEEMAEELEELRTIEADDDARLRAIEGQRAAELLVEALELELEDLRAELVALRAEAARDPFERAGAEIAAMLRSAKEAGETLGAAMVEEARVLVDLMLEEAEVKLQAAKAEADRMVAEARSRVDDLVRMEAEIRREVDAAAWAIDGDLGTGIPIPDLIILDA